MRQLPFQAVAFDLDDTLLHDDLTISNRTVCVLRTLASLGVTVIPASGRAYCSMKPFVRELACASFALACNGAEIWDVRSEKLLREELFSAELGREIAAFGNRHHCYMQTYADDSFFYNDAQSPWSKMYAASSRLRGVCVGNLERFIQEPRSKILMMDSAEKIAQMLTEACSQFEGRVSVTCSKPTYLEFNPLHATKGFALEHVLRMIDLSPDRLIAFGDSLNDLSMLRLAGRGILMANGRAELRALCDAVCPSNQEDGVAVTLEELFRLKA